MTLSVRTRNFETRNSRGQAPASTHLRRTHSVPRTQSGRLSQSFVAKRQKEALKHYSEGDIATVADCTKDTAQSWKLGRRAANTAYMLMMARSIDEIGLMIAEEADLGRFYNQEGRIRQILQDHAMHETPEGKLARAILRQVEQT